MAWQPKKIAWILDTKRERFSRNTRKVDYFCQPGREKLGIFAEL